LTLLNSKSKGQKRGYRKSITPARRNGIL